MTFHGSEYLYLNDKFSDITFIVENKSTPAHKMLLASCPYFETMLFGATNESKMSTIELKNVSLKMFLEVLRCIYQGKVEISGWTPEEVKTLIQIADEYQFPAIGSAVAESINVDTQIEDILEDIVHVAEKFKCVPLMEKCAASVRRSANVLFDNQDAFDKLPMELICFLIDTRFWHPADKRLVFSIGNWRKTDSVEDKKRLLSKIEWKSLPAKYSAPLLQLLLENDVDGIQTKDWTNGLKYSNANLDLIAGVLTSYKGLFLNNKCGSIPSEFSVLNNQTRNGSVVIFFREQVTTVTKIKFNYFNKAEITLTLCGEKGSTYVTGTKINDYWEFILPSDFYFSVAAFDIRNREFNYSDSTDYAEHIISGLQFLYD